VRVRVSGVEPAETNTAPDTPLLKAATKEAQPAREAGLCPNGAGVGTFKPWAQHTGQDYVCRSEVRFSQVHSVLKIFLDTNVHR